MPTAVKVRHLTTNRPKGSAMFIVFRTAVAAALVFATPAFAQSDSLGLSWIEAGLTASDGKATGHLSGDWRIGAAQGIQLDLGLADQAGGAVGNIDGHIYLAPQSDRKYGFFLSFSDIDGRDAIIVYGGIEGIYALSAKTVIEGRAGVGYASRGFDFIAAEARITHAPTDRLAVSLGLGLADFQEARFNATSYRADLSISYTPEGSPFELSAAVVQDGLWGNDSAAADTRLQLGLTWRFGDQGGPQRPVTDRAFRAAQPMDGLIRRGVF